VSGRCRVYGYFSLFSGKSPGASLHPEKKHTRKGGALGWLGEVNREEDMTPHVRNRR
jgi:hypothetical protein